VVAAGLGCEWAGARHCGSQSGPGPSLRVPVGFWGRMITESLTVVGVDHAGPDHGPR
jgi:pyruvate/2-oxoacid:ferredoxin oxidoreductase alpha subunit